MFIAGSDARMNECLSEASQVIIETNQTKKARALELSYI